MKTTNKYKNKKVLNLYNNQKLLLFIEKYSLLFLTVYSICGFTDILDGYISKKNKNRK